VCQDRSGAVTKTLLCTILRWHSFQRVHADGGGYYAKCRRCGREHDVGVKFGG